VNQLSCNHKQHHFFIFFFPLSKLHTTRAVRHSELLPFCLWTLTATKEKESVKGRRNSKNTESITRLEKLWLEKMDRFLEDLGNATEFDENTGANSTEAAADMARDSTVLRNTFSTYGTVLLVVTIVFCWARQRFHQVYNVRGCAEDEKSTLAKNQYGFFSWFWQLYLIPDDSLLEEIGMDALCFLRICSLGMKLVMMGMFVSMFLLPLYGTAPWSAETAQVTDNIVKLTTANVAPGSPRLIGTALAAWMVFGFLL